MKYALIEGYNKTKARCMASAFGALLWFGFSWFDGFTKTDALIALIFLSIAVIFADVGQRKQLVIKRAKELVMKSYRFKWRSLNVNTSEEPTDPIDKVRVFHDVQWKEYGARVRDDQNGINMVIPYTSIYDIDILSDEEM